MSTQQSISKWARLNGEARATFQRECVELYVEQELSVRQIVKHTGRSYGSVHSLLVAAGVQLRPRGNPWKR